jgi:hypothetical protein
VLKASANSSSICWGIPANFSVQDTAAKAPLVTFAYLFVKLMLYEVYTGITYFDILKPPKTERATMRDASTLCSALMPKTCVLFIDGSVSNE